MMMVGKQCRAHHLDYKSTIRIATQRTPAPCSAAALALLSNLHLFLLLGFSHALCDEVLQDSILCCHRAQGSHDDMEHGVWQTRDRKHATEAIREKELWS